MPIRHMPSFSSKQLNNNCKGNEKKMSQFKIKTTPIIVVVALVCAVFGGRYAYQHGLLGPSSAGSAVVPVAAPLPALTEEQHIVAGVNLVSLPSKNKANVASPEI